MNLEYILQAHGLGGGRAKNPKLYGVKIDKNNSNPATRIEYTHDAIDFTPARMNYGTGKFDYGSWGDLWFIKDNYPCMVKYDGTEDYKLNPNDYTQKLGGGASDIASTTYQGNAMSAIPLVWIKQYEDTTHEYIIISNGKIDETYNAFAHTRADGSTMDKIYLAMFKGGDDGTRLRSISGMTVMHTRDANFELGRATANGSLWSTRSWAHRNLVNCLLTLISKHDNSQTAFGNGNIAGPGIGNVLKTGTLNSTGQFMGYSSNTQQVKVFHMEGWWADHWERIQGLASVNGGVRTKMTPPYNFTGAGFQSMGVTPGDTSGGYINKSKMTSAGRIPWTASGTSETYQCDGLWFNNTITAVALVGGDCYVSVRSGLSCVNLGNSVSAADWSFGAALSCEQPFGGA